MFLLSVSRLSAKRKKVKMLQLPDHLYSPQDLRTNRICGGLAVFVLLGLAFNNDTIVTLGGVFAGAAAVLAR